VSFELAIERDELVLASWRVLERAQQLLILALDLVHRTCARWQRDGVGHLGNRVRPYQSRPRGTSFPNGTVVPQATTITSNCISRRVPIKPMPMPGSSR
jgi:hypothetical protein